MVEGNPCIGGKEQILSFSVGPLHNGVEPLPPLFAELWSSHGVGSSLPGNLEILANLDLVSHQQKKLIQTEALAVHWGRAPLRRTHHGSCLDRARESAL